MLNKLKAYSEAGKRAAVAMNQRDIGRYQHENAWLRVALSLESPEDRKAAREAYDQAFRDSRNIPPVEYFR